MVGYYLCVLTYKRSQSFQIGSVNSEVKWKTMVLTFGFSASNKDGTPLFRRSRWVQIYMSPLNHKMEPLEPADHKLLNTKEGMLINNIF